MEKRKEIVLSKEGDNSIIALVLIDVLHNPVQLI